MAEPNSENNVITDEDFVTVTADGWYTHFQEGFISLIFYQNRAIPRTLTGKDIENKRRILFEVRLPLSCSERLASDLNDGNDIYTKISLLSLDTDRDFWVGGGKSPPTEQLEERNMTLEEINTIAINTIGETVKRFSKKGMEKFKKLFQEFLFEHMEEIRQMAKEEGIDIASETSTKQK